MSTEVVTLLTVVFGFIGKELRDHFAWKRRESTAKRQREQDAAERAEIARSVKKTEQKVQMQHEETTRLINDNTALTAFAADRADAALTEANRFDRKWRVIERMFNEVHSDPDQLSRVKAIVSDTNNIVRRELTSEDPLE